MRFLCKLRFWIWFLWNLWFWKCYFFLKNAILKPWISWIMWLLICGFLDFGFLPQCVISGSCQHWLDYIVAFEKLGEPKKVDIDVNQLWVTRFWDLTSIGIYLFCSMSPLPLSPLRKLLLRSKFRRSSHPTSKKICTVFQNH